MRVKTASAEILVNYHGATKAVALLTSIALVIAIFYLPLSFTERSPILEEEVFEAMTFDPMVLAKTEKKAMPEPTKKVTSTHQVEPVNDPPPIETNNPQPIIDISVDVPIEVPIEIPIEAPTEAPMEPTMFPEVEPAFPGGEEGLIKYLAGTPYPEIARDIDEEGLVYIQFVIDKKGNVVSAEVLRSESEILAQAALKRVLNMPQWTPGRSAGRNVPVKMVAPFNFKLR